MLDLWLNRYAAR